MSARNVPHPIQGLSSAHNCPFLTWALAVCKGKGPPVRAPLGRTSLPPSGRAMGEVEQTQHELLVGFTFLCHASICSSCPRGHPQHQTDKWTRQRERTGNACKRLINKFVSGQMRELVRASQHQSLQHNTAAKTCLQLQQPGEGEISPECCQR